MFVRMSFTITMAIFGAGLICYVMLGRKNQSIASPTASELQPLQRGAQTRPQGLETQKRQSINTLSAEGTVLSSGKPLNLRLHDKDEYQLMAYGEGVSGPNGLTSPAYNSLELWCHPALKRQSTGFAH
jgi:hypothetical protein